MSLFPIRLKPGGTITVHLRLQVRFPMWLQRKDFLIDPNGKKTLCYERTLPFLPPLHRSPEVHESISESGQIVGGAPILMAARYLQTDSQRSDQFLEMLVGLRDDTHHYYTLTLPDDAPLGRYTFELEDRANGKVWRSGTADTDCFYLEKLELVKVKNNGSENIAYIENPSPEPVMAQICESIDNETFHRFVKLDAKTVSQISFKGSALLVYRDGDEILRLTETSDKGVLANPKFEYRMMETGTMIYSKEGENTESYELRGLSEDIWVQANGFATRMQIRKESNASVFDEMLAMGLILEID